MQTDIPDIISLTSSAELCRLCHLPTPHSAVARSEQLFTLPTPSLNPTHPNMPRSCHVVQFLTLGMSCRGKGGVGQLCWTIPSLLCGGQNEEISSKSIISKCEVSKQYKTGSPTHYSLVSQSKQSLK